MAEASENSGNRQLLLLKLTDGHSEITAIEYTHVPSFPDYISLGPRDTLNDHRRSLAARVNAPSPSQTDGVKPLHTTAPSQTVQLQKTNGVKPLHTTEGKPEKATASKRPKVS
ncbi:uncharacterized protein LOC125193145 [Salvia hispanica]|uniref:uncharacterized protein LOC125193145 n=1 Tax=Salvia hispanica TaxID=49212 RepID=UPI0020095CE6|nr:uncharacterized protein LOC125193145 [Salvia hispanica]